MRLLIFISALIFIDFHSCELQELKCDEIKALTYYERYYGKQCTISDATGDSSSTFVIRTANNFEYSKNIQEMEFINCKLYDMPREVFATFQYLKKAQANNCGIEDISKYNFNYASELSELRMRSNKLKKLPNGVFSQLANLRTLDLSSNQLEDIQKDAFSGLTNIQYLILTDNKITKLDENLFRDLSSLTSIRLDSNKLQVIDERLFATTMNLTEIRLDSNEIAILNGDPFGRLKALDILNLGNNRLSSVNISETNLERFFMPYNKLTRVDINKNLKLLYAPYNEITEVNLNGNTVIREIKMRQNLISDISNFSSLTKLEVLDLSYNPLNPLNISSFARMSDLVRLNLEYTKIPSSSLTFGTFGHNFNLSNLDLSYNQLGTIDFNIFTALSQLTHLKIDGNNLTEIPHETIKGHFPRLSLISLNDNDWNCTYLWNMTKSLKQNNVILFTYSKLKVYDETNVDGIRCVKNNTNRHIQWDVPVLHIDDDESFQTTTKKPQRVDSIDLIGNFSRLWNKIFEIESTISEINDAMQDSRVMSAIQREAQTWSNNQERDMIIQSEVGFIKIILCFICFVMSVFVAMTIVKFVKTHMINQRIYYPSESFRQSTATIQTTMEHVM